MEDEDRKFLGAKIFKTMLSIAAGTFALLYAWLLYKTAKGSKLSFLYQLNTMMVVFNIASIGSSLCYTSLE